LKTCCSPGRRIRCVLAATASERVTGTTGPRLHNSQIIAAPSPITKPQPQIGAKLQRKLEQDSDPALRVLDGIPARGQICRVMACGILTTKAARRLMSKFVTVQVGPAAYTKRRVDNGRNNDSPASSLGTSTTSGNGPRGVAPGKRAAAPASRATAATTKRATCQRGARNRRGREATRSWYDALTARLVAQVGKGFTLSASYAHGRNFSNGNNIDQSNINQYYGPTQQDIAHTFTAQFTYELPVGRGNRYLSNSNRAVDALLGGWQYSGLLTIRSGAEAICLLLKMKFRQRHHLFPMASFACDSVWVPGRQRRIVPKVVRFGW
jgi:hypothetical protein